MWKVAAGLENSGGHVLMKTGARRIVKRYSQVWGKRSIGVNKEGLSLDGTERRSGADKV